MLLLLLYYCCCCCCCCMNTKINWTNYMYVYNYFLFMKICVDWQLVTQWLASCSHWSKTWSHLWIWGEWIWNLFMVLFWWKNRDAFVILQWIFCFRYFIAVSFVCLWEQTSLPSGVCWWLKKGWVPVDVFSTGWRQEGHLWLQNLRTNYPSWNILSLHSSSFTAVPSPPSPVWEGHDGMVL